MQVVSYELVVSFDFKKFTSCEFLFTSWKAILRVGNLFCELEIKLWVASCFLQVASCFFRVFKKIILRVASCVLWVENLKNLFYKLPVAFYEFKMINLRVAKLPLTS